MIFFTTAWIEDIFSTFLLGKGPGKRGHIIADTLLPKMFLGLRKLGNICCGHKMFLNKIRSIFCVPDTKFVSATNVARGQTGNICVGNNVSSFARALNAVKSALINIRVCTWSPWVSSELNADSHGVIEIIWRNILTKIILTNFTM